MVVFGEGQVSGETDVAGGAQISYIPSSTRVFTDSLFVEMD